MTDVMVVAGTRTAIGDYGGAFKDIPPTKLGSIAIKEAISRGEVDPATIGHVVSPKINRYLDRAGMALGRLHRKRLGGQRRDLHLDLRHCHSALSPTTCVFYASH